MINKTLSSKILKRSIVVFVLLGLLMIIILPQIDVSTICNLENCDDFVQIPVSKIVLLSDVMDSNPEFPDLIKRNLEKIGFDESLEFYTFTLDVAVDYMHAAGFIIGCQIICTYFMYNGSKFVMLIGFAYVLVTLIRKKKKRCAD